MRTKHRPKTPNIMSGITNTYYHADGITANSAAESRIQNTLNKNLSSKDWVVGDTKEVYDRVPVCNGSKVKARIKIAEFHESREFLSNKVKVIFNEGNEVFHDAANPGNENASQAVCKLKRIIKDSYIG